MCEQMRKRADGKERWGQDGSLSSVMGENNIGGWAGGLHHHHGENLGLGCSAVCLSSLSLLQQ